MNADLGCRKCAVMEMMDMGMCVKEMMGERSDAHESHARMPSTHNEREKKSEKSLDNTIGNDD